MDSENIKAELKRGEIVAEESEVTAADVEIAHSLISALIVKGHGPAEVAKVLTVAQALANVVFSPHEEGAKANHSNITDLFSKMTGDLWKDRDLLEEALKAKVRRLQPLYEAHEVLGALFRRGNRSPAPPASTPDEGVKAAPEPQTEQFRR